MARTWADLAGLRIGILGAGVEGAHAFHRLRDSAASLVVVDDSDQAHLDGIEVLRSSPSSLSALEACDVIVKSPGFSRYRPDVTHLLSRHIPIVGSLGLSLNEVDPARVIGVTGTKGKSTTSSIITHLARGLGKEVLLIGNIGATAPPKSDLEHYDFIVAEISSFQALDIERAPGIVVVTSLGVDHLDWHGSAEQYQHDKLSLSRLPGDHLTIAQGRSPELRAHHDELGGRLIWSQELAGSWSEGLGLVGDHNRANAEIARVALEAAGIDLASDSVALAQAAAGFETLQGRLSLVATIDGVDYFDDSLATNVSPTMAALDAFEGRQLALLVGGYDRGIDYEELISRLAHRTAETLVIGLPDSGAHFVAALAKESPDAQTSVVQSVSDAVRQAHRFAKRGSVVLLSPAAPSFSQFRNWKERSDAFRACVAELDDAAR